MSINGITYFRLNSPYEGDVTKNCGLTGSEVDNNFFVLEGRDIKTVSRVNDSLLFTLFNGNTLSVDITPYVEKATFEFDHENGVLKVTQDGVTQEITGFKYEYETNVARDYTLIGDGTKQHPLSISPLFRTSHYAPVKSYIDKAHGQYLPSGDDVKVADRFLISYNVYDYGYLYNYKSVRQIACDLQAASSDWRIPSKEDWDDLLNAIEPRDEFKNHNNSGCNQYFGEVAGKLLKSQEHWRNQDNNSTDTPCPHSCCGCTTDCQCPHDNSGEGLFGFDVLPSGYMDDGGLNGYFGERASFWTSTTTVDNTNAYIKRFEYNKSTVFQDIIPSTYRISLRLVKDYDGGNFYGKENILGETFDTVLMPSQSKPSRIWTATSVAFDTRYNPEMPNGGADIEPTIKYSIVEWDGTRWISNQFVEGDVVAIVNAPNGEYNAEYKLVHNELVSLQQQITDNIVNVIQERLTNIETSIQTEIEDRIAADTALSERIDQEVADREQAVADEAAARQSADDALSERISQEVADREQAVADEAAARQSADEALSERIGQEVADRELAVADEAAARRSADEALNERISQEVTDREQAVADEAAARQSADEALSERISQEVADREQAVADEAAARQSADDALESQLLSSEGTGFDSESGVLTLKSKGGTNDISIQFSFNFGNV